MQADRRRHPPHRRQPRRSTAPSRRAASPRAVMGNPINAIAWLANKLHEYGVDARSRPRHPVGLVHQGDPVPARRHGRGAVRHTRRGHLQRRVGADSRCATASRSAIPTSATTRASSRSSPSRSRAPGSTTSLAAEHVIGGHPDRAHRREGAHLRRALPRALRAVRLSSARSPSASSWSRASSSCRSARPCSSPSRRPSSTCSPADASRLGVGVGRNWMEYEALNEDFTNRGARVEEQVEVLRRLWTEELVTFDGEWHHLDRIGPQPDAGAAADPDLDGLVRRQDRREGDAAHGTPGRRLVPAVPARARARRRDRRGCGATPTEAGRDPPSIGIECGDPRASATTIRRSGSTWPTAYRDLGATHLRVMTAGGGYETPAGAPRRRAPLA